MLLITGENEIASAYSSMLYHIGILSYVGNFDGNIINGTKAALVITENGDALGKCAYSLPEFILSGEDLYFMEKRITHKKLESAANLADKISKELSVIGKSPPGKYCHGVIVADVKLGEILIKNEPVSFTKTEKGVLRAVIAAMPDGLTKENILSVAFRQGREPLASSIRVHIAKINKKLLKYGAEAQIFSECGKYRLYKRNNEF